MALISVIQPNPTPRKKSTWDKVVEGITVANSLLGTGIAATKLYNEFQQTGLEEEKIGILKSQAETEKAKTAAELMNKIEPAKPNDPLAFKLDAPAIGLTAVDPANQYYKWKPQEFEAKDWIDNVKTGLWRPLDAVQTEKFKAEGRPVSTIRIKGLSDPQNVFLNVDEIEKTLTMQRKKAEAEVKKTEAETKKLLSEGQKESLAQIDEIYKQRAQSAPFKNSQDVQSVIRQLQDIEKNPTAATDLALVTVFNKALDPTSRVTDNETRSAAAAGSFGSQIQGAMNSFLNGKKLGDQQRNDLLAAAKRLVAAHQVVSVQNDLGWIKEAQNRNIDPARVIREYDWTKAQDILGKANQIAPELQMIDSFDKLFQKKAPGGGLPQTVIQGDYTYTLNPKTGKYE